MKLRKFLVKVSLVAMAFAGVGATGILNQTQVHASENDEQYRMLVIGGNKIYDGKTADDFAMMSAEDWKSYIQNVMKNDPRSAGKISRCRALAIENKDSKGKQADTVFTFDVVKGLIEGDLNGNDSDAKRQAILTIGNDSYGEEADVSGFGVALVKLFNKDNGYVPTLEGVVVKDDEELAKEKLKKDSAAKVTEAKYEEDKKKFEETHHVKFTTTPGESEVKSYPINVLKAIERDSGEKFISFKLNSNFTEGMAKEYFLKMKSATAGILRNGFDGKEDSFVGLAKAPSSEPVRESTQITLLEPPAYSAAPAGVKQVDWDRAIKSSVNTYNSEYYGVSTNYGGSSSPIHSSFLTSPFESSSFSSVPLFEKSLSQKFDGDFGGGVSTQGSWNNFGGSNGLVGAKKLNEFNAANNYGLSADPEMAKWYDSYSNSSLYKQDASSFSNNTSSNFSSNNSKNADLNSNLALIGKSEIVENDLKSITNNRNIDSRFKNLLEFVQINVVSFNTTSAIRDAVIDALKDIKGILQDKKGTSDFDGYVESYKTTIGRYLDSMSLGVFVNGSLADLKSDYGKQLSDIVKEINEVCNGSRKKLQGLELSKVDDGKYEYVEKGFVPFAKNSSFSSDLANKSNLEGVPAKGVVPGGDFVNKTANSSSSVDLGSTIASKKDKKSVSSSDKVSKLSQGINGEISQDFRKLLKKRADKIAKSYVEQKKITKEEAVALSRKLGNYFKDLMFDKFSYFDALLYSKGTSDVEYFYDNLKNLKKDLGLDNVAEVANTICDAITARFENFEPENQGQKKAKRIALRFAARVKKGVFDLVEKIGGLTVDGISSKDFAKKYNKVVKSLNKFDVGLDNALNDVKSRAVRKAKAVKKYNSKKAVEKRAVAKI